jgi:TPP-dependent pyruvate/acetoin dehydrogenase alpha subunit
MATGIRNEVQRAIEAAVAYAEASPEPGPELLYADLFAEEGLQP